MDTMPYKVTLSGAGLTLERAVTKHIGDQIAVLILTGAEAAGGGPDGSAGGMKVGGTKRTLASTTSVREFLNASGAKRSPDKIAAIGVYFLEHEGKEGFSKSDIEKGFEAAAEPVPGNLARDINWAIKASWIAERSGDKGSFYVTNSGKDAVTRKFPKELLKKTRIEPQNKKGTKKASMTA
jgi:hypothetical protein